MTAIRAIEEQGVRAIRREAKARRILTTQEFAAISDHARLPWRFFGRFTASIAAGLSRA